MMRLVLVLVGLVVAVLAVMLPAWRGAAGEAGWGAWTDSDRQNAYCFMKGNVFRFSSDGKVVEGVWQTRSDICWLGATKGNVMVSVDTYPSCLGAQFLGGKLVLSEIWTKGIPSPAAYGVCSNRVLTRYTGK